MSVERPDFTVRDTETGVSVIGPWGDEIATFVSDVNYNPAYLAFLEGIRRVPGASVWHENTAKYIVANGEFDSEFAEQQACIAAAAKAVMKSFGR